MILVTGAAGHLGNNIVRELVAHGHPVRAMLLPGEDPRPLLGVPAERVEADLTRPETLGDALKGVQQVVHTASIIPTLSLPEALSEKVNVGGTQNLIEASLGAGVQRLIYVSSLASFVPPTHGRLAEDRPLALHSDQVYDRTKAQAAELTLKATALSPVVVAPTGIVGPDDFKPSEQGKQIKVWTESRVAVVIPGGTDYADVRDLAAGVRRALKDARSGEMYLLGGEYYPLAQLAWDVMQAAGKRPRVLTLPLCLTHRLSDLSAKASERSGKPPALNAYGIAALQHRYWVDSSKARQHFGYTTRPMSETIRDTVAWWKTGRVAQQ